jgi:geranylgeranyl diphosphate synthase, type II
MFVETKNIQSYLQEKSSLVDQRLNELVPDCELSYNLLYKAARYSLIAPGKRLRPILALATVEALGGSFEAALSPACTLEMVHTYSLIHDDLPSMDDDDLRRGKPTLHKVYPEGQAILAGDFLLTFAFEVLAESPLLSPQQKVQLVSTLAKHSGGKGMVAGQVMDLQAEGQEISFDYLKETHKLKTAGMITASIEFGGIIANATTEQMQLLRNFGQDIGLAFQIVDDILDITSSDSTLGKPAKSDIANEKVTYVSLLGLEKSKACAETLYHSALSSLNKLNLNTETLASIAERIICRKS